MEPSKHTVPPPRKKASKKTLLHLGISIGVTVALLFAVFSETSFQEFVTILKNIHPRGLGIYFLLSLSAIVFRALRYRVMLKAMLGSQAAPKTFALLIVTAVRNALVDFLPARLGEAGFLYVLHRTGVRVVTTVSTFGLCLVLDILVLVVIIIGLFVGHAVFWSAELGFLDSLFGGSGEFTQVFIVLGLIVLTGIIFLSIRYASNIVLFVRTKLLALQQTFLSRFPRLAKLNSSLCDFLETMAHDILMIRESGHLMTLVLLTFILRLLKYGALAVLLMAVLRQWGHEFEDISLLHTVLAFLAAEAAASLPVSGVMGFGAYEAAWVSVFSFSGLTLSSPKAAILAVHLITQVVGYGLGIVALTAFFGLEMKKSRLESS